MVEGEVPLDVTFVMASYPYSVDRLWLNSGEEFIHVLLKKELEGESQESAQDTLGKMAITFQQILTVRIKFNQRCRPLVDEQDYGSTASFAMHNTLTRAILMWFVTADSYQLNLISVHRNYIQRPIQIYC